MFRASNILMGVTRRVIKEGSGATVQKGQNLTVHCTGKLADGKKFWSTKDAGQSTFSFQVGVGKVIRGWDEGCLGMKIGETVELTCTGDYAYGAGGFSAWGIGPNATLVFEIEALSAK